MKATTQIERDVVRHTEMEATPNPALERALQGVLARVPDLMMLLVSTTTGPLIIRVNAAESASTTRSVEALETFLPVLFTAASSQIDKMRAGRTRSITMTYDHLVLVHVDDAPLTLTFVAEPSANLGLIWGVVPLVRKSLEPVRATVIAHDAAFQ